jgi:hypothetical protein
LSLDIHLFFLENIPKRQNVYGFLKECSNAGNGGRRCVRDLFDGSWAVVENGTGKNMNQTKKQLRCAGVNFIQMILFCLYLFTITNSYSQETKPEGKTITDSGENLTIYSIAGIDIKLPSRPTLKNVDIPGEGKKSIRSLKLYETIDVKKGLVISVTHVLYVNQANLDGSTEGAIAHVKNLPTVVGFSSTKEKTKVSGLEGIIFSMKYKNHNHDLETHGLVFARDTEMWQIQIVGPAKDRQMLEALKAEIISSVALSK